VVARFRADLASLQPSLAPIVVRAVEKLVGSLDRQELVQACLGAALTEISAEVEVTLFVPPQDADFFRSQIEALGASGDRRSRSRSTPSSRRARCCWRPPPGGSTSEPASR
jgi:hypothetical protein